MLQLLAKGNDIFTGGREYYNHPNYRGADKPTIIHQSSATGMQAIPTTGVAQGFKFLERTNSLLLQKGSAGESPIVICSLGDASVTEGEVSEAFQFAALHQLPIIYLVQDNDWGISVTKEEARTKKKKPEPIPHTILSRASPALKASALMVATLKKVLPKCSR